MQINSHHLKHQCIDTGQKFDQIVAASFNHPPAILSAQSIPADLPAHQSCQTDAERIHVDEQALTVI